MGTTCTWSRGVHKVLYPYWEQSCSFLCWWQQGHVTCTWLYQVHIYVGCRICFAIQHQLHLPDGSPNPFKHYPHFPASLYSAELSPTLETVQVDWVTSHFAWWIMSPEHAVILSLSLVSYLLPYHISTDSVYRTRTRIFWGVVLETHVNEHFIRISYMLYICLFDGWGIKVLALSWGENLRLIRGISGWWKGDEWVLSGQWVGSEWVISGRWSGNYFKLHAELKIGMLII